MDTLFNSREPERTSWAVTDDGARLRVVHHGPADAPVLVLVHGWSCCVEYWNPQINALAERYHVIAYDQRDVRGPIRTRLKALFLFVVGMVIAVLTLPLLVLGRYSYPFLDHIEVASTTTAVASVTNVLRGANHWIAYILTAGEHPTWQSGWVLAQSVDAIIAVSSAATALVAAQMYRVAPAATAPALAALYLLKVLVLGWFLLFLGAPPWLAPRVFAVTVLVCLVLALAGFTVLTRGVTRQDAPEPAPHAASSAVASAPSERSPSSGAATSPTSSATRARCLRPGSPPSAPTSRHPSRGPTSPSSR
mgnify:CR=1 FL=1